MGLLNQWRARASSFMMTPLQVPINYGVLWFSSGAGVRPYVKTGELVRSK